MNRRAGGWTWWLIDWLIDWSTLISSGACNLISYIYRLETTQATSADKFSENIYLLFGRHQCPEIATFQLQENHSYSLVIFFLYNFTAFFIVIVAPQAYKAATRDVKREGKKKADSQTTDDGPGATMFQRMMSAESVEQTS